MRDNSSPSPLAFGNRELFTRKQTAAMLNISQSTLIRYAEARIIRETRLPSPTGARSIPRYSREAITAFLHSGYLR